MRSDAKWKRVGWIALLCACGAVHSEARAQAATPGTTREQAEPENPVLKERPPQKKQTGPGVVAAEGRIRLDVVVSDASGKPVIGLGPWDFKLLDDGRPQKIMSFRAFDGVVSKPDPAVEVVLVMDMANLPFQQVAFVRDQVVKYLRADGGQLKQPTILIVLSDKGIRVQPRATTDGNAEAKVVQGIEGGVRTLNSAMGGEGALERFQLSVRQLEAIAENEAPKPGRKLVIWVGPGWPMLTRSDLQTYSEKDQKRYFDGIVELSTKLREARIALYSVSPMSDVTQYDNMYRDYLNGVKSAHEADSANLALKVLAVESGGAVMGPDNDLVGQINRCVADANTFYRISFNPAAAEHADEYHELKVIIDKPGAVARTNTGYYNEPAHQ